MILPQLSVKSGQVSVILLTIFVAGQSPARMVSVFFNFLYQLSIFLALSFTQRKSFFVCLKAGERHAQIHTLLYINIILDIDYQYAFFKKARVCWAERCPEAWIVGKISEPKILPCVYIILPLILVKPVGLVRLELVSKRHELRA